MGFLIEWVTNIIIFILLATVIDMLLPNSSMQKYTKMVTGLLLIAVLLGPVLKIISGDFENAILSLPALQEAGGMENSKKLIEMKKKEIQASQQAYILEQMAVRLKKEAEEELMERYGFRIAGVEIDAGKKDGQGIPNSIKKVAVLLTDREDSRHARTVEAVVISVSSPAKKNVNEELRQSVASFLAEKWSVPESSLEVAIEGG
ncbi:stage III sporulation protein AF [Neobacillus piezotolerans]|uniref:Stage III sporulation protein AF n=1 Tax=Neobacillus piezotolerans TaxID=2259171 RepID=A0A3D8GL43_9BACI|nr:stage III sporulation protein AF [Neobacillus piezotolerans]RDU35165.1 stage III sporulation protein AF [Neobacillus piezotolerans]